MEPDKFYESVKDELLKLNFSQCKLDQALFYIQENRKLRGIICCHVDDFLQAGDNSFEKTYGKTERKIFCWKG